MSVFFTLCASTIKSVLEALRPLSLAGRANLIFNARSSRLTPSWPGSLHWAKYECTVRHLGKSLGSARHWQPVRGRYSTAQNTSYSSTVLGLVLRLACASSGKVAQTVLYGCHWGISSYASPDVRRLSRRS